jgi:lysophospholipase L1-like esterase
MSTPLSRAQPYLYDPQTLLPITEGGIPSPVSGGGAPTFTGLPVLKAAVLAAIAGGPEVPILAIGDSTGRGTLSGGGGLYQYPSSIWHLIAASVNWGGATGNCENVIGWGGTDPAMADFRVAHGGWTSFSNTLGGAGWQANSAVADLVFSPTEDSTEIDIYYLGNSSFGSFSVKIDGQAIVTISGNIATSAVYKATIKVPPRKHTIAASWVSGAGRFLGYVCRNRRKLNFLNVCVAGSTTSDWVLTGGLGFYPFDNLAVPAPKLIDISLGINDANTGVSATTFQANLLALTNKAKATGADVTLTTFNPTTGTGQAALPAYRDAYVAVSAATGAKLIDFYTSVGGVIAGLPGGMADASHPNMIGYAQKATYWLAQVQA